MFALSERAIFVALIFSTLFVLISAECPNACSSHGKCGAFDACQCYRNWMANDCSERKCLFSIIRFMVHRILYLLNKKNIYLFNYLFTSNLNG